MDIVKNLTAILLILIVILSLVFLTREVWCWYFKLNSIKSLLENILKEIKEQKESK